MNEKQNKVNIYELAKATGFSSSTVSKALNNTGRISEKTREKILKKATELNYVASYHAKALSQKKSNIIAIIYSDNMNFGLSHPHFSVILEHFKQEAENSGYEVTFVNRKMGGRQMTYLEFCNYRKVDGVFLVNYYSQSKQIPELIESGIPVVTTDAGSFDINTVISNDIQGGRKATEYLVDLGHEKIFHFAGPLYTSAAQKRLKGFLDIISERKVKESQVFEAQNFGFDDGYNMANHIIHHNHIPTAIFIASDWMALGAMKAFKEKGFNIPEDISIIGYDNLEFLQFSSPALTTVSQNKREIGINAARNLIAMIEGEERESVEVDVSVVERETCKRIN